ncbi:MAG: hypothetical protein GY807_19955, partial [Gammaproteobacteria bacterium]|nr:hypothetical protein [Gammaproteobacteria bacterium]
GPSQTALVEQLTKQAQDVTTDTATTFSQTREQYGAWFSKIFPKAMAATNKAD